ncbi:carboxypeptidase-like regulatory domain-containing protein, partial [Streptomyces sp. NPDC048845]|uniref:carboxypeptidase-like regulatory domain-containing protein n=1 Tax=Streptomyces sp. NPDC048845 TaxID=3155390 RepID=UPI00342D6B82
MTISGAEPGTGPGAGLRARIRTRDGWAVRHAILTVTDMTGNQVARATADEDGTVRTDALPAGAYTVIATAVGYAPAASTAIVTASGRADVGTVVLARQGGVELPPPGVWTLDPAHSSVAEVLGDRAGRWPGDQQGVTVQERKRIPARRPLTPLPRTA